MSANLVFVIFALLAGIVVLLKSQQMRDAFSDVKAKSKDTPLEKILLQADAPVRGVKKWPVYLAVVGGCISAAGLVLWYQEIGRGVQDPPSNAEHFAVILFFAGIAICIPFYVEIVRAVFRGRDQEKRS